MITQDTEVGTETRTHVSSNESFPEAFWELPSIPWFLPQGPSPPSFIWTMKCCQRREGSISQCWERGRGREGQQSLGVFMPKTTQRHQLMDLGHIIKGQGYVILDHCPDSTHRGFPRSSPWFSWPLGSPRTTCEDDSDEEAVFWVTCQDLNCSLCQVFKQRQPFWTLHSATCPPGDCSFVASPSKHCLPILVSPRCLVYPGKCNQYSPNQT